MEMEPRYYSPEDLELLPLGISSPEVQAGLAPDWSTYKYSTLLSPEIRRSGEKLYTEFFEHFEPEEKNYFEIPTRRNQDKAKFFLKLKNIYSQETNKLPEEIYSLGRIANQNFIENNTELKGVFEFYNKSLSPSGIGGFQTSINAINAQFPTAYQFDIDSISPEDLPEMTLPVLEFLETERPHVVIGCDRGGRLFSLAMHATWQHTRGTPFPTVDGKIHFTRISKSEDEEVLQQQIDHIVETANREAAIRGNEIPNDEQLRVMFVDDWIVGGGTHRLAKRLLKKHGAKVSFVVMTGTGGDASGSLARNTSVSWHDRPEEIGVNYMSIMVQNSDGTITDQLRPVVVKDDRAVRNRKVIINAAKSLQYTQKEQELVA